MWYSTKHMLHCSKGAKEGITFLMIVMFLNVVVWGQAPVLQSVSPSQNSNSVSTGSSVSATYDQAMNPATVSKNTFAVHGKYTGRLQQTFGVSGGQIMLTPDAAFRPGELVQATATVGTLSMGGNPPAQPFVWEFRTTAGRATANLEPSSQILTTYSKQVRLGDIDGDGDLDAILSYGTSTSATISLNDGSGSFSDSGQLLCPVRFLETGDLDGDGDLDIFMVNSDALSVWVNDGTGVFNDSGQNISISEADRATLGDLDGDGDLDAFIARNSAEIGPGPGNMVFFNGGTGAFTDSGQSLGSSQSEYAALGDLDGDGDLDAFVANVLWTDDSGFSAPDGAPDKVWLNNGSGFFSDSAQSLGDSFTRTVALADFDGDGDLDALAAHYLEYDKEEWYDTLWINNGSGSFSASSQVFSDFPSSDVNVGDMDGDDDIDIYISTIAMDIIWLNDGSGYFQVEDSLSPLIGGRNSGVGDLDGDNDLDVFMVAILLGDPDTIFFNSNGYAPMVERNLGLLAGAGQSSMIGYGRLYTTDSDNEFDEITYRIETFPVNGTLKLDGITLNETNRTFTQQDVNEEKLTYEHDGLNCDSDPFTFIIYDNSGNVLPEMDFSLNVYNAADPVNSIFVSDTERLFHVDTKTGNRVIVANDYSARFPPEVGHGIDIVPTLDALMFYCYDQHSNNDKMYQVSLPEGAHFLISYNNDGDGPFMEFGERVAACPTGGAYLPCFLVFGEPTIDRQDLMLVEDFYRSIISSASIGFGPLFDWVYDVAVESDGNILLSGDYSPHVGTSIQRVDPATGNRVIIATSTSGSGPEIPGGKGMAIESENTLIVCGESSIVRLNLAANSRTSLYGSGPACGQLSDVAVDAEGYIYLSDRMFRRIYLVDKVTGNRTVVTAESSGFGGDSRGIGPDFSLNATDMWMAVTPLTQVENTSIDAWREYD